MNGIIGLMNLCYLWVDKEDISRKANMNIEIILKILLF
jgi:hypothetical protein